MIILTHRMKLLKGMLSSVLVVRDSVPLTTPVVLCQVATRSTAALVDTRVRRACVKNPVFNFLERSLLHLQIKL